MRRRGDSAEVFARDDALTHPQYHLKLLLERMGLAREEVRPWHRNGASAAEPARSRAISSLFLPPKASALWVTLDADHRRLPGLRTLTSATSEEEAQGIALLVREALEVPEKRVAVVSADRSLARRVGQHLARWNIAADDTAGRPLSLTPAGRLFALLADIAGEGGEPVSLIATLSHPLIASTDTEARRQWLENLRAFEKELRGPSRAPGLDALRQAAHDTENANVTAWWEGVEAIIAPLLDLAEDLALSDALDAISAAGEALAGEAIWAREDGRALARMVEDTRFHAGEEFSVRRFDDYAEQLTKRHVILDADRRKDMIATEARNLAFANGVELVEDEGLLEEEAGHVEWTVVLMGEFEEEYHQIPDEVVLLTLKNKQK